MADGNSAFETGSAVDWNSNCYYLRCIRIGRGGHRCVLLVGLTEKGTKE